jgi:epoxyqueuosine reductase
VDLPLPPDEPASDHCGSCSRCLDACPTGAIVAPYRLDARRCISYLTIEADGAIPLEFRQAIGNRIYGCDDCQLACPWNRWARPHAVPDFAPRHRLDAAGLVELFGWTEDEFAQRTAGSAIARIGHARWLRNLAVALGNARRAAAARGDAAGAERIGAALRARAGHPEAVVREHVDWALAQGAPVAPVAPGAGPERGDVARAVR